MNTDLTTQLLTARTAMTQQSVEIAVFKKAHEMQTGLLETLMASAKAVLPAGQGGVVDKSA